MDKQDQINARINELQLELTDLRSKLLDLEEEDPLSIQKSDDWGGYTPGTQSALDRGCICPVDDNESMPENERWVHLDCPIHGKKVRTKWEMNTTPLKWNNDYKFVPAPPQDGNETCN